MNKLVPVPWHDQDSFPFAEYLFKNGSCVEDAVTDALTKATLAIPALHWFELTQIAGYVADGRPKSWHVKLRAGIPPEK